jgi:phosphoesterase RecJ-like protein
MNFKKSEIALLSQIEQTQSVLITVHQFPDIDAIGSALALYIYLKSLGKEVVVWTAQKLDNSFDFLSHKETIIHQIPTKFTVDTIFVLDCSSLERVRDFSKLPIEEHTIVNIDHHPDNERFGHINYLNLVSSVGEMLAQFFMDNDITITSEMAACLYAAISFDTGRFAHSNVTETTLQLASLLVRYGASPVDINHAMDENKSVDDFDQIKMAIDALHFSPSYRLAYTSITIKKPSKIKVIDFIRQLGGIDVFVVFQVLNQGLIKVNLRSRTTFDVSCFSKQFGGGGHHKASGILYKGTLEDCHDDIISALKEAIKPS